MKRISRKAKKNVLIIPLALFKYMPSQSIPESIPKAMATSAKNLCQDFTRHLGIFILGNSTTQAQKSAILKV